MELHQKIAVARKKKGFTQGQLAEMANVTVRTIQRLESGESVPRPYTIKAIAAALDTTFEMLTADVPGTAVAGSSNSPVSRGGAEQEKHFLEILCLSCFSYLVVPLVHFLIPVYLLKRSGQQNHAVIAFARLMIRRQVYWAVTLSMLLLLSLSYNFIVSVYFPGGFLLHYIWIFVSMYLLNAILISTTLWRIRNAGFLVNIRS
ncbi:helix-turn-helix domain-containing protein [Chitinophaga sp. XS-30]|uniref:helix-turn-helix domain-containing protein n=1 Tax=Chitinophaga sp. XS-30 TaxID=2604421 RepID=UPI00143D8A66|nr:helix-turn-helix transcriptional regulator [Chitinophaga sp. XS-30]